MRKIATLLPARARRLFATAREDEQGQTAVEFALVIFPFMFLLFGIIAVCVFYFETMTAEQALIDASRDIRTGAVQGGTGSYAAATTSCPVIPGPTPTVDTKCIFKQTICDRLSKFNISCANDVRVWATNASTFGGVAAVTCLASGDLKPEASVTFSPGGASTPTVLTACIRMSITKAIPFLKFGNMSDGSHLIQVSTALKVEPF